MNLLQLDCSKIDAIEQNQDTQERMMSFSQRYHQIQQKISHNLKTLFLFYSTQLPNEHGLFERRTLDDARINLHSFMIFCRQFNILSPKSDHFKKDSETPFASVSPYKKFEVQNTKRTEVEETNLFVSFQSREDMLKEKYRQHFKEVKARHKYKNYINNEHSWWNETNRLNNIYNKQNQIAQEMSESSGLKSRELTDFYKKNAFQGKTLNFEEFQQILKKLARFYYKHQITDNIDVVSQFYREVLTLHKTKQMESRFKRIDLAFNIKEQVKCSLQNLIIDRFQKPTLNRNKNRSSPRVFAFAIIQVKIVFFQFLRMYKPSLKLNYIPDAHDLKTQQDRIQQILAQNKSPTKSLLSTKTFKCNTKQ